MSGLGRVARGLAEGEWQPFANGGLSQISRMLKNNLIGKGDAKRLERAFDQVTGLNNRFEDEALHYILAENLPIGIYEPKMFRRAAYPLNRDLTHPGGQSAQNVQFLADLMRDGVPMRSVPSLHLAGMGATGLTPHPSVRVTGHEGRHRNRAMEVLGFDRSMMGLHVPTPDLTRSEAAHHPPKIDRRLRWMRQNEDLPVYGEAGNELGPLRKLAPNMDSGLLIDVFRKGGLV